MDKKDVTTVDQYISNAVKDAQPLMAELRELILKVVPAAEEQIAWNVPIYKTNGAILAGYDATEKHVSFGIDCLTDKDREALEADGHKTGKTTFQIAFDQVIPTKMVTDLLRRQQDVNEAK